MKILIPGFLLLSCAPTQIVRPLQKDEKMISLSLGGPFIGYSGINIPMPLTTLHYAQGVTNKTTAFASLHTTSLLYGVFQTDLGICQSLYYNKSLRIGFSANPILNMAIDRWEKKFKLWPQLDLNAY